MKKTRNFPQILIIIPHKQFYGPGFVACLLIKPCFSCFSHNSYNFDVNFGNWFLSFINLNLTMVFVKKEKAMFVNKESDPWRLCAWCWSHKLRSEYQMKYWVISFYCALLQLRWRIVQIRHFVFEDDFSQQISPSQERVAMKGYYWHIQFKQLIQK